MKVEEAVKATKEGKKVRRQHWIKEAYMYDSGKGGAIRYYDGQDIMMQFSSDDFEAIDWQIVEETKTLSDKRKYVDQIQEPDGWLKVTDVKEAIKKFIDKLTQELSQPRSYYPDALVNETAKEIFGEKLC